MPQLVKLQEKYKDQGFTVVATHKQNIRKERVISYLKSAKVNFTVTSAGHINLINKLRGLPAAYLFNSEGRLVASGRPANMEQRIVQLIRTEPHFLASGREFTKLKNYSAALKAAKSYGPILKRLEEEKTTREGEAQKEAKFLISRIRGYGRKRLRDAKKLEATDPTQARKVYREVARLWQGDEIAERAIQRVKLLDEVDKSTTTKK